MILPLTSAHSFRKPQHKTRNVLASCSVEVWFSHSLLNNNCYKSSVTESDRKMNCNTRSRHITTTEEAAAPHLVLQPLIQISLRLAMQASDTAHPLTSMISRFKGSTALFVLLRVYPLSICEYHNQRQQAKLLLSCRHFQSCNYYRGERQVILPLLD